MVDDLEKRRPQCIARLKSTIGRILFLDDRHLLVSDDQAHPACPDDFDGRHGLVILNTKGRMLDSMSWHSIIAAIALNGSFDIAAFGTRDREVVQLAVREATGGVCFGEPTLLGRHGLGVRALTYHPHQDRLFSAGEDGAIKVWHSGWQAELLTFARRIGEITRLTFDESTDCLIASSSGLDGRENCAFAFPGCPPWEEDDRP